MFFTWFSSVFNSSGNYRHRTVHSNVFVSTKVYGIYVFVLPMSFSGGWELCEKYTILLCSSHGLTLQYTSASICEETPIPCWFARTMIKGYMFMTTICLTAHINYQIN